MPHLKILGYCISNTPMAETRHWCWQMDRAWWLKITLRTPVALEPVKIWFYKKVMIIMLVKWSCSGQVHSHSHPSVGKSTLSINQWGCSSGSLESCCECCWLPELHPAIQRKHLAVSRLSRQKALAARLHWLSAASSLDNILPGTITPLGLIWNGSRILSTFSPYRANQALSSYSHPSHFSVSLFCVSPIFQGKAVSVLLSECTVLSAMLVLSYFSLPEHLPDGSSRCNCMVCPQALAFSSFIGHNLQYHLHCKLLGKKKKKCV